MSRSREANEFCMECALFERIVFGYPVSDGMCPFAPSGVSALEAELRSACKSVGVSTRTAGDKLESHTSDIFATIVSQDFAFEVRLCSAQADVGIAQNCDLALFSGTREERCGTWQKARRLI